MHISASTISALVLGFSAAVMGTSVNGQQEYDDAVDEYSSSSSDGILVFNSTSDSIISVDRNAIRSSQGFIFDCDNDVCPDGPYQDVCPQCDDFDYDSGASAIQCSCFDSQKVLQDVSTIRDSQTCDTISADSTGTLVCNKAGSLRKHKRKHNKDKIAADDGSTPAPTPDYIATASPTIGSGPVHVDFKFNCVEGKCPTGQYQTFCPRCSVNTDSSTPGNDPEDSISCLCFNANGQMLLRTSTMWNFEACPKIVVDSGGELECVGAPRGAKIRTYGGRRLETKEI